MNKNKIESFTDLYACKVEHELVMLIYKETENFPKKETFYLVSQMRRAIISITSNIAEGFSHNSPKEKFQFYNITQESTTELQNQILIARDVDYINRNVFNNIAQQTITVAKLLYGLKKIKSKH